jgi:hypothetical protein
MNQYTLCQLRDYGLVQNNGRLVDSDLSLVQSTIVIKQLLNILNNGDLTEYLELNSSSGRLLMKPLLDCIVYQLAVKMNNIIKSNGT